MALPPGTRLGSHEVLSSLGAGGMGEVYRARDTKLGREVAIKALPAEFATDRDRTARFEREAQTLAALHHPHIAGIHELLDHGGSRYLVLELVEGETLADRLRRGTMPIDEALPIARQIADALEAAHERGIVHRDLKPANIIITPDGVAKVLDFGLAKSVDGDASSSSENSPTLTSPGTRAGVILGTAAYMSPEQAKGRPIDRRTDVWAFGCVLYEMLCGTRAFAGEDVTDLIVAVLSKEPDLSLLPGKLPVSIARLVRRCLAKDRKNRLADMGTARLEIDEALSNVEPAVRADTAAAAPRAAGREMLAWAIAAVGLVFAIVTIGYPWPAATAERVTRFQVPFPADQVMSARNAIALSADGTQLAYVGSNQLFLRRFSDFDAVQLLNADGLQPVSSPAFSPSGTAIAYHSLLQGAIMRVSTSGGQPVRVCDQTVPPGSVSWDAKGILVGAGGSGVRRCDPNGGPSVEIAAASQGEFVFSPQLLRDGDHLLMTVTQTIAFGVQSTSADIVVHSLKAGTRRTIVENAADGRVLAGRLLYWSSGILFAVPFDETSLEIRGEPVAVVEGVRRSANGTSHVAISDNGTLAYIPGPVQSNTATRDLAIGDRQGAVSRLPVEPDAFVHVRAAPDGRHLAIGTDNNKDAGIWIYDLQSKDAIRRFTLEGQNRYPIWSPDGRWLAFQSDRAGDAGIYRQRVDGTGAERLTTAAAGEAHAPESWSSDGRYLSYAKETRTGSGFDYSLWVLTLDKKTSVPFGLKSTLPITSMFSPDGRWIAYTASPTNEITDPKRGIFVQPFPQTGAIFQGPRVFVDYHPTWTADGKQLVYVGSQTAGQMVSVGVSAASGLTFSTPERFPATVIGDWLNSRPRAFDLLPDGRLVGVIEKDRTSRAMEIRVIVNLFEELKPRAAR